MLDRVELDIEFVRSWFPALQDRWALMDNAGGSVVNRAVTAGVVEYLEGFGVQLGASYTLSKQAQARVRQGEATAAEILGTSVEETVVGPSTTVNLATLARAMAPRLVAGDEVIVTDLDHEANIGPWRGLAAHGAVVRTWTIDRPTAGLVVDDLERILSSRTRVVALTHCANVVGAIIDIPAVVARVRAQRPDAWIVVDGVAFAPHRLVDVDTLGIDAYAVSLYKIYGPHLGAMYVRRPLLELVKGQNHEFVPEDALPYKLQPGNVNHELTAGLPGIGAYFDALAEHHSIKAPTRRGRWAEVFGRFAAHEQRLAARLLEFLGEHPRVCLIGPAHADCNVRVPTIAFVVNGRPASSVVSALDEHRVAVRWGHFYAKRAIDALGLTAMDGIIRVSMVHYNTLGEVERLIEALSSVLK